MKFNNIFINGVEYSGIELVDAKIVALLTGLSVRTIQDKASKREIPVHKVGNRCNRYRISEILDWVDNFKI